MQQLILFCILLMTSCSNQKDKKGLFEPQRSLGTVINTLDEASGLVASVQNPGYLWTHNDGNNSAEIFLINEKAEIVMTANLKNIFNRDWEDITTGPGPQDGVTYLYVADIGDNDARFKFKRLYRVKEPKLTEGRIELDSVHKFTVKMPDGPRDTEAIMVDPISKNFYLISKRESSVRLYEIGYPFSSDTLQAEKVGVLPFTDIVAANVSSDGSEVLLKNYSNIYYWKRNPGESIPEALQRKPIKLDYDIEPQGEAIAWKSDGSGFYTLSESKLGIGGNLYFYKRK